MTYLFRVVRFTNSRTGQQFPKPNFGHQPDQVWRIKNPANWQGEILIRVGLKQREIKMEKGWLLELTSSRKLLSGAHDHTNYQRSPE